VASVIEPVSPINDVPVTVFAAACAVTPVVPLALLIAAAIAIALAPLAAEVIAVEVPAT
jgi:hypothetical protein